MLLCYNHSPLVFNMVTRRHFKILVTWVPCVNFFCLVTFFSSVMFAVPIVVKSKKKSEDNSR